MYVKFQCVQDKTAIVDRVNIGDEIKVFFNIKGSKWEKDGKTNYITNLDAWRIEQALGANAGSAASKDFDPNAMQLQSAILTSPARASFAT